jgi:riboflavin kinase/FMN adenylyltransferase
MKSEHRPHLYRHPASLPSSLRGGVVALGNFDGVHRGHQQVIAELLRIAAGRPAVVVSFYPHPVKVLKGTSEPKALSSLREKRDRLGELGVQLLYGIHFTKAFARVTAKQFIEDVLVKSLDAKALVVGEDVAIGFQREGNLEFLKRELPKYSIELHVVPTFKSNHERPSSRRIRELLAEGDVQGAAHMIGAPFTVSARVGHGDKRGRTIGFPTANVSTGARLLPKRGVYSCLVEYHGRSYPAVANIGIRPTFNGRGERLEVHIIGETFESLYGKRLHVGFVARLRDEKKFGSIDELKSQIAQDVESAKKSLGV